MTDATFESADPSTVKRWLDAGEALMVDVREPDEFAREHIAGAHSLPQGQLDRESLPPSDGRRIVLHCASGARSRRACEQLQAGGGERLFQLEGGIAAWKRAGLPLVVDRAAPLPLMRQVQIAAGLLVLVGVVLGVTVHPWFLALSAFVGAGLTFSGVTGYCGMAELLARMPWNRRAPA
jgi:rhodanese-related sulfurtransferase